MMYSSLRDTAIVVKTLMRVAGNKPVWPLAIVKVEVVFQPETVRDRFSVSAASVPCLDSGSVSFGFFGRWPYFRLLASQLG